jgi:hypothetical protein
VPIEGVPHARIYAQEAATLRGASTQRRRWTAGKLTVLARWALPLLRSGHIGAAQKLDAIAELSRPGPVVHLCLVVGADALALVARPAGAGALAALLTVSLLRPFIYSVAALCRDPEPRQALGAFLFLPIYAAWRAWTALTTLATLGDKAWVRTQRPGAQP